MKKNFATRHTFFFCKFFLASKLFCNKLHGCKTFFVANVRLRMIAFFLLLQMIAKTFFVANGRKILTKLHGCKTLLRMSYVPNIILYSQKICNQKNFFKCLQPKKKFTNQLLFCNLQPQKFYPNQPQKFFTVCNQILFCNPIHRFTMAFLNFFHLA